MRESLRVARPVTLIGCSGTALTVSRGSISVLSQLRFIETSLAYACTEAAPKPLFEVWNSGELILSDCTIKSSSPAAVCVFVCPLVDSAKGGCVRATACSFSGFFTHVMCGKESQLAAENCSFRESSNSSICAMSPQRVSVVGSSFESAGRSAVEVRLVSSDKGKKTIDIEDSTVLRSRANGITVCGDKLISSDAGQAEKEFSQLVIKISNNTITDCEGEGIEVRNVGPHESLLIQGNKICSSGGNGISLISSVGRTWLEENSAACCKQNGILVCDSPCKLERCECYENLGRGVLVQGVRHAGCMGEKWAVIMTGLSAHNNADDGVGILDSADTKILFEDCKIEQNAKCGISIKFSGGIAQDSGNKSSSTSVNRDVQSSPVTSPRQMKPGTGQVVLKGGRVQGNKVCGVAVCNMGLYIDETAVKTNGECALIINCERERVVLSNATIERGLVQGVVIGKSDGLSTYDKKKRRGKPECCAGCVIV